MINTNTKLTLASIEAQYRQATLFVFKGYTFRACASLLTLRLLLASGEREVAFEDANGLPAFLDQADYTEFYVKAYGVLKDARKVYRKQLEEVKAQFLSNIQPAPEETNE